MSLVDLTAVAYHQPEKFDAYDDVLPQVTVPDTPLPNQGGEDAGGDVDPDTGSDAGADTGTTSDIGGDTGGETGAGDGGGEDDDNCNCTSVDGSAPTVPWAAWVALLAGGAIWRRRWRN